MSGTTEKAAGLITEVLSGAQKVYGFKDGEITGFGERVGAFAGVAIPTVFLNDRFRIKPALAKLPRSQAAAGTNEVFAGGLTIGQMPA
jgi:hypothetical protein